MPEVISRTSICRHKSCVVGRMYKFMSPLPVSKGMNNKEFDLPDFTGNEYVLAQDDNDDGTTFPASRFGSGIQDAGTYFAFRISTSAVVRVRASTGCCRFCTRGSNLLLCNVMFASKWLMLGFILGLDNVFHGSSPPDME